MDELDPQLLRRFALAGRPAPDDDFSARVMAQVRARRRFELGPGGLYSLLGTITTGLATGIAVPLRIRHAWLMLTGAAAATLWALI
jgi:hypothetical protein